MTDQRGQFYSGQENPSSWDVDGPEIGVWNPATANTARSTPPEPDQSRAHAVPDSIDPTMNNQFYSNYPLPSNNIGNAGTSGYNPVPHVLGYNAQPPSQQHNYYHENPSTYRTGNFGSNFEPALGRNPVLNFPNTFYEGNCAQQQNYQQYYEHPDTKPNLKQYETYQTNTNYNPSGYAESTGNSAKSFKNPFLNDPDDDPEAPDKLIQQLHLQETQARKNGNDSRPTYISKSALAMLKQDLNQAGLAFKSAEHLKLARDAHLGFDVTESIGSLAAVSNLSINATEFVPKKKDPIPPPEATKEDEEILMKNLNEFIDNILQQPGEFDQLAKNLMAQMKGRIYNEETVKNIVHLLFQKAIDEDNFKYLGAKFCSNVVNEKIIPSFRSVFLTHMQSKYKEIVVLLTKNGNDQDIIHGFSMFMAEVFIHMKINGSPLKALGRSFSKLIDNLLSKKSLDDIKFVCKVLKLTGRFLMDAFKDSEEDMTNYNKNFDALKQFLDDRSESMDPDSQRVVAAIQSVLSIRDSNWGRTNSVSSASESAIPLQQAELSLTDSNYYMNEPVFFTPEGVQYTAADAQLPDFYDKHLSKIEIPHYIPTENNQDFPWSAICDDLVPSDEEFEMYKQECSEAEYDNEYENFLRESGQL